MVVQGALPVALMLAGAALMVIAARGPRAELMREARSSAPGSSCSRGQMTAILLFILLFKLGDAAMGFMVKPFWVDAGFSNQQIGLVSVSLGLAFSIAGGLLGGWYVDKAGIFRGLWVLGLWRALSNLATPPRHSGAARRAGGRGCAVAQAMVYGRARSRASPAASAPARSSRS